MCIRKMDHIINNKYDEKNTFKAKMINLRRMMFSIDQQPVIMFLFHPFKKEGPIETGLHKIFRFKYLIKHSPSISNELNTRSGKSNTCIRMSKFPEDLSKNLGKTWTCVIECEED